MNAPEKKTIMDLKKIYDILNEVSIHDSEGERERIFECRLVLC